MPSLGEKMTLDEYVRKIKFRLTGGILELEVDDSAIASCVMESLSEVQRYINETRFITVPFAKCIDLKDSDVSMVAGVYRPNGYTTSQEEQSGISDVDPMYSQQWMVYNSGYSMYNLQNWILNYSSYNTLLQMKNTTSTDLAYKYDRATQKLYINVNDLPSQITIEYIPKFKEVDDIQSDYWQDVLLRMSIAQAKLILGMIRTRYKLTNTQWEQDGDTMRSEGNTELNELREQLRTNSQITYLYD